MNLLYLIIYKDIRIVLFRLNKYLLDLIQMIFFVHAVRHGFYNIGHIIFDQGENLAKKKNYLLYNILIGTIEYSIFRQSN